MSYAAIKQADIMSKWQDMFGPEQILHVFVIFFITGIITTGQH
jgi:hypothetical protein